MLLLLGFGIYFLIKGADLLVDGSSSIARRFGVSELIIGLTVVAFGTSMPELFANVIAAWRGSADLALGNIVGSNIANILLVLGVTAIICPIVVKASTIYKEIPFSFLAATVLLILVGGGIASGNSVLTIYDAMIFLALFILFLYYMFSLFQSSQEDERVMQTKTIGKPLPLYKASFMLVGGVIALTVGGEAVVTSAKAIALQLGISQTLLGLTVIALGTSLPELATSVRAALKHKTDIAVGNVVGSNIFNIFLVLGLTAFTRPIPVGPRIFGDILIVIMATVFLFLSLFFGKRRKLERWNGVVFVMLYFSYIGFTIFNEFAMR